MDPDSTSNVVSQTQEAAGVHQDDDGQKKMENCGRKRGDVWKLFTVVGTAGALKIVKCNHCGTTMQSRKKQNMVPHVEICKEIPEQLRQQHLSAENPPAATPGSITASHPITRPTSQKRRKNEVGQRTLKDWLPVKDEQDGLIEAMMEWIAATGQPLSAVDNPFFVKLVQQLRPSVKLPARCHLRYNALPALANPVRSTTAEWFANKQHITISLDGWTGAANKTYYVVGARCTSGAFRFVDMYDVSDVEHTSDVLLEMLGRTFDRLATDGIALDSIVAVVTDNGSTFKKARNELPTKDGFRHIIPIHCFFHAINLCMADILNHPTLKYLCTRLTAVTTYFHKSHMACSKLKRLRKTFGVTKGLARANRTRNTSVYEAINAVYGARDALRTLLQHDKQPDGTYTTISPNVAAILDDDEFFAKLRLASTLLHPFATAMAMIQARDATVADATHGMLYISKALEGVLRTPGHADIRSYVVNVFNARVTHMPLNVPMLALYLDPRRKHLIQDKNDVIFKELHRTAALIVGRYGRADLLDRLESDLLFYRQGTEAMLKYIFPEGMPTRQALLGYWHCKADVMPGLSLVGKVLAHIVPHGCEPERVFSVCKSVEGLHCHNTDAEALRMLLEVCLHLQTSENKTKTLKTATGALAAISELAAAPLAAAAGPSIVVEDDFLELQYEDMVYQSGDVAEALLEGPIGNGLLQEMATGAVLTAPIAERAAQSDARSALEQACESTNPLDGLLQHLALSAVGTLDAPAVPRVGPMLSLLTEGHAELQALVAPGGGVVFQPQYTSIKGNCRMADADILARY